MPSTCLIPGLWHLQHSLRTGCSWAKYNLLITHMYFPVLLNLFQEDRVRLLHQKWASDPDVVMTPTGVKFIGPGGRDETEDEHLQRLQHNADMRFHRSFKG